MPFVSRLARHSLHMTLSYVKKWREKSVLLPAN
jgi:hypothetical protein